MKMVKLKLQIERHKIQRPVYLSDERFKKMQEEEKRRNESDKKWTKHLAEVREAIENQYNVDKDRKDGTDYGTDVDGERVDRTEGEEGEEEEEYGDSGDFGDYGEDGDRIEEDNKEEEGYTSDKNTAKEEVNNTGKQTGDPTG